MTLFIGFIVQCLHIALMAAAAPTLAGAIHWLEARLAGRAGSPVLQPWRDLLLLSRKQSVVAESASDVTSLAPMVCAAATAIAAALVPSFALGMTLAPLADLVVIAALLALVRCSLALAAMDVGTAIGGIGASRAMLFACLSEPALLLVVFVLALLAGSSNIDLIASMQIEIAANWRIGAVLAFAAMLPLAWLESVLPGELAEAEFSGFELVLIRASAMLRVLVWFNLIGALFLPYGMAASGTGPLAWAIGLACWLARTVIFAGLLAVLHIMFGRIRVLRVAQVLGIALVLGVLAMLLLLPDIGTA